jgi:hypothetical protein
LGEPFLHINGRPRVSRRGGYCSRRSGCASSLDAFHLPPIMLTQALSFHASTEAEEARSLGVPYTGVFPVVEPPSATGICSVYVAIFQACPCFASGTLEVAGGASPPSAPPVGFYYDAAPHASLSNTTTCCGWLLWLYEKKLRLAPVLAHNEVTAASGFPRRHPLGRWVNRVNLPSLLTARASTEEAS